MRIARMAPALVLVMSACGPAKDATNRVAIFHQRLDAGDYDAIWRETGPDIRNATSKEGFVAMLATVHGKLGKVRETKQTSWNSNMDAGGSVAELTHRTTFENGSGEENFVYRSTGEGLKLAG